MAEELFKKKISKEEKKYREAVELQNAVSCVLRFESKREALYSAAKKFEKLGDFKDSGVRAQACRKEAARVDREGSREVFEDALEREKQAKNKSDYVDAITEFRRVVKKKAYAQEARQHIAACKQRITKLESRKVWKQRLIAVGVVVCCAFLFMQTPLYPFAKGYVHQQLGAYEAALANYKEASSLSWTEDLSGVCYYKLGRQALEEGDKKEALRLFRKARKKGNKLAKKELKRLRKELDGIE